MEVVPIQRTSVSPGGGPQPTSRSGAVGKGAQIKPQVQASPQAEPVNPSVASELLDTLNLLPPGTSLLRFMEYVGEDKPKDF
jgi:hypothetical protein